MCPKARIKRFKKSSTTIIWASNPKPTKGKVEAHFDLHHYVGTATRSPDGLRKTRIPLTPADWLEYGVIKLFIFIIIINNLFIGSRLAYVFWQRGYYRLDHEDHRWEYIRKCLHYPEHKLTFHTCNFVWVDLFVWKAK